MILIPCMNEKLFDDTLEILTVRQHDTSLSKLQTSTNTVWFNFEQLIVTVQNMREFGSRMLEVMSWH